MTTDTLIEHLRDGTLPKVGITRRTGAAARLTLTASVDGEITEPETVTLDTPRPEEAA